MKKHLSLSALVGTVIVLAGVVIGLHPIGDNSFFTHLATGRIILDTRHVPSQDPYTFTVAGHAWVVQSWLASVVYAVVERVGGLRAVMVSSGIETGVLAWMIWRLTRPARTLIPRLVAAGLVVGVGAGFWVERPLLFGLVAFGALLLVAEGQIRPAWLVPTMWIWVNTHGSFPLGLVALGALYLGRRLDHEDAAVEREGLKWALIGTIAGAINPIGPRILLFPLELLSRQDILRYIVEWQAPRFQGLDERFFLLEAMLAIAVLIRRPRWRAALPLAIFLGAALLGARNVVTASLVLVPGLAGCLQGLGTIDGSERRFLFRPAAAVVLAGALVIGIGQLDRPLRKIDAQYPVRAIAVAEERGLIGPGHRLVAQDFVGNYLEGLYGRSASVFIDDRYDMFPKSLVLDYADLLGGRPGWQAILSRRRTQAVIWRVDQPLSQLLQISPDWRVVYLDSEWLLAVPAKS